MTDDAARTKPRRSFGYDQTIKYEVARDLLNTRRASLSAKLGTEDAKDSPDPKVIEELKLQMNAVADDIEDLDVTDDAGLDRSIAMNRR